MVSFIDYKDLDDSNVKDVESLYQSRHFISLPYPEKNSEEFMLITIHDGVLSVQKDSTELDLTDEQRRKLDIIYTSERPMIDWYNMREGIKFIFYPEFMERVDDEMIAFYPALIPAGFQRELFDRNFNTTYDFPAFDTFNAPNTESRMADVFGDDWREQWYESKNESKDK